MATETKKILIRRGSDISSVSAVDQGELLLDTSDNKVYVGTGSNATKQIANLADMGVTAEAADINKLDNLATNATQLGYLSNTTSDIQAQLDAKAALAGPTFTGDAQFSGTVSVQTPSENGHAATKSYVDTAISNLIDGAPEALDTLSEIASSLAPKASPSLTGTPTAPTAASTSNDNTIATTAFVKGEIASVGSGVSGVTASADELNILDGATLDTAELNLLDGVTVTTAQLNSVVDKAPLASPTFTGTPKLTVVDGETSSDINLATTAFVQSEINSATAFNNNVTASSDELNILDGATLNTSELNILQGASVDTAELNVLHDTNLTQADLIKLTDVTASAAEINKIDGFTGTFEDLNYAKDLRATEVTATEFDYLDGVTSSIQTQLDAKAVPGNLEWRFVQKITETDGTLGITNSSITNENFDIANYDYKFVVVLDTNAEDNSIPLIRLNSSNASIYNYLYERVNLDAVTNPDTGANTSLGGYDQSSISTGLGLDSENQNVSLTNLNLEFVVSQSNEAYTYGGTTQYALMVEGKGSALAVDAPNTTPKVWPVVSRFTGSVLSSSGLTRVDIIHNITAGTTDNSVVRIYKRAK